MTRPHTPHRRGFTLIELVVSLATTSVLLLGAAGTLALAARALPTQDDPAATARSLASTAEIIRADASTAVAFATRDTALVLPDADSDGKEELVEYTVENDTLYRVYNDGEPVRLLGNVGKVEMTAGTTNDAATLTTIVSMLSGSTHTIESVCLNFETRP